MKELGSYDPKRVEERWSKFWIERGIYHVEKPSKESKFSVVIPPPNVTGSLHMGHALNATLQDIVVRWQRMRGKEVVWVPGFDHAGIATQYVVEKQLRGEGKSRLELGRQEFLKRVWDWVPKSRNAIREQLEKLGVSVDWRRERFTLDEGFSRAVRKAFRELYEAGLIYRSEYIVNWCPKDLTALSDLEVEHEEEKGKLWYIKYPLEDGSGYITVATTRPETMLGDTAVAVHPEDERYRDFVGKRVRLPLVRWKRKTLSGEEIDELIPVIADERVKPEFGTGAVKVTPAHDPNDFEIGRAHNLPFVKVMDERATMNENAGEFAGLERYEARKRIIKKLREEGLLEREEEHVHAVGRCYRCKTVVEPMVSEQWFVKVSDPAIKNRSVEVVEKNSIRFIPEHWRSFYLDWMYNLRDWCISRQIWWGHRIPVWYCEDCAEINVFTDDDFDRVYDKIIFNLMADGRIGREFTPEEVEKILKSPNFVHPEMTVLDFYKKFVFHKYHSTDIDANSLRFLFSQETNPMGMLSTAKGLYRYNPESKKWRMVLRCRKCGSENLRQEDDVLDTWFSSALWPFGVFGWPEETEDLRELYPTDLLVTGFDIIFFWVAKMIMMGTYLMKEIPFQNVYVHALVRDEKGQKMSKTKGNVIDPLDIIERYGADALRFTLAILTVQGRDIKLSEKRFEGYKHFTNKIWNASRYVLMNTPDDFAGMLPYAAPLRPEDRWIMTKLNETAEKVNKSLENYEFSKASQAIYDFFWSDFCDWYIEFTKERIYRELPEEEGERAKVLAEKTTALYTLHYILEKALRILHPFMPFITEEIWQMLPGSDGESISLKEFPERREEEIFPEETRRVERLREIITAIRSLRSDLQIEPSRRLKAYFKTESDFSKGVIEEFKTHILSLAKLEEFEEVSGRPEKSVATFSRDTEVFLLIEGHVDLKKLIEGYERKRKKLLAELERVKGKLGSENFIRKAPPEVVEKEKRIKEELESDLEKVDRILGILKG